MKKILFLLAALLLAAAGFAQNKVEGVVMNEIPNRSQVLPLS